MASQDSPWRRKKERTKHRSGASRTSPFSSPDISSNLSQQREKYKDSFKRWNSIINKTVDLFLRLNTEKAEIVTTVLFTERTMNKKVKTEQDVFQEVMKWKQKRRPPLEEKEVAETIRNLGVLRWFKLKPSADLPIEDDWVVH